MADVNLFDLAARISVDASQSDKALTNTQKKVLDLAKQFQETEKTARSAAAGIASAMSRSSQFGPRQGPFAAAVGLKEKFASTEKSVVNSLTNMRTAGVKSSQDLSQALGTLSPRLGMLAGAAGPLTAVAGGLVALGATAAGIYKLATFAAQLGGEIFDLSQKVNFSAETLSSLKVAAELSGGSLESMSTSLGIFDRNLEEAHDKGSEMSRVFKALKIDIDDNEKALRQAFQALASMPPGYQQTALAMKLFGRSGKEMLGIIKETGGDVDKFIEQMRELGLVITSEGAKKADEFGDRLTMLQNKLAAIGRQIGTELIPIVERAANDVSNWLTQNQGKLQDVAKELANVVSWAYEIAKIAATPIIFQISIVRKIIDTVKSGIPEGPKEGEVQHVRDFRTGGTNRMIFRNGQWIYETETAAAQRVAMFTEKKTAPRLDLGGGGGGGRGGGAKAKIDAGEQLLKQLERELDQVMPERVMWERLMGEEYSKTADKIKKKIYITDLEIQQQKKINALTRERLATGIQEREEFQKFVDLVQQSLTRARTIADYTRERFATKAGRGRPNWLDLGGGSTFGGEPATTERPRIATAQEQVLRDQLQMHREKMQRLAADLTGMLDNAIYDGFSQGAARGFATLAQGLLDIVNRIFLARLEEGLTSMLSSLGGKSSGGSWWSKLLGIGLGAIGGKVGGSSPGGLGSAAGAFAGGFASGGTIPMGMWGNVHAGEKVVATPMGAQVIPGHDKSGPSTINVNFYVQDARSLQSRDTQAQVSRQLKNLVQRSAMITG